MPTELPYAADAEVSLGYDDLEVSWILFLGLFETEVFCLLGWVVAC